MHSSIFLLMACLSLVAADMYFQNFRGSNNRLNEANRDRDNANRLFDSQNNNRGGYNVGGLYFYEGEISSLEWTNQHGCGNTNNDCQIIIQYMCDPRMRDGTTTNTIPQQPSNCLNFDCNNDDRFGMHEDYDYYTNCRYRYRNAGIFTADRNLNGNTAIYTRQNEGGNRRGYECPEEREYYPYWHPTPWIDIVVFTNHPERCSIYQAQSENVLGRNYCWLPNNWYHYMVGQGGNGNQGFIPNTQTTCENLNLPSSPMYTYLRQQAGSDFAAYTTPATAIASSCSKALLTCYDGNNNTNPTCLANFLAGTITLTALNTQFPFPYPTANVARSNTSSLNNGCPSGYRLNSSDWSSCVEDYCSFYNNSLSTLLGLNTQIVNYLNNNNLFVVDGGHNCVAPPVYGFDCVLASLPSAAWTTNPSHNTTYPWITAPDCQSTAWSRPNHLGNGIGGFTNGYNISIPPMYSEHCAFRLRYNISTVDYNGLDPQDSSQVNSSLNRPGGENAAKINIAQYYGIPMVDSTKPWKNSRGYLFKQNPTVQIFDFYVYMPYCSTGAQYAVPGDPTRCFQSTNGKINTQSTRQSDGVYCPRLDPNNPPVLTPPHGTNVQCNYTGAKYPASTPSTTDNDFTLQLAINTNQFGRTFQDRSHNTGIRQRDPALAAQCDTMYALNVRGKRGNIVQTFPGTEYDFTPNRLMVSEGDCIHFQWTGSNTNPFNNDGEGLDGSDRHNIALLTYIRGQGGEGVESYGGLGAHGTTWTTKNEEPGWQNWVQDMSPTMADVQCPPSNYPDHIQNHPYNWLKCVQDQCQFVPAPCPSGFIADSQNSLYCTNASCFAVDRPSNPTNWTAGLDPLDPTVVGFPASQIGVLDNLKHGAWGENFPEHLDNVTRDGFLGLSLDELINLATLNNMQLGGQMSQLDDAGTFFDLAPHTVTGVGTYHYMCTRNNNFSNRSQKAKIVVSAGKGITKNIGSTGAGMGVSSGQSFTGVAGSNSSNPNTNDYFVNIPAQCLNSTSQVSMFASPADPSFSSASDFLYLGPQQISCQPQIQPFLLAVPNRRRTNTISGEIWGTIIFTGANSIQYTLFTNGPGFENYYKSFFTSNPGVQPFITVQFEINNNLISSENITFDSQFQIVGVWVNMTSDQVLATEQGQLWIVVYAAGQTYMTSPQPDPATQQSITIQMPVSVSLTYGKVYRLPDTADGATCASGADEAACSSIRQEIPGATVQDGVAVFTVGYSRTDNSAGYYYVSPGSNLAIIVGVTVACVVMALAAVGSAVYFRKHPEKWDSFKQWGPRKMKAVKRSFASHV